MPIVHVKIVDGKCLIDEPINCPYRFTHVDYKGYQTACQYSTGPKQCKEPFKFPKECPLLNGFTVEYAAKQP